MTTITPTPSVSPPRTGVMIGIATITMSFAAYTSAMVVRQSSGADWQAIPLPPILYFNTLVLLASSATFVIGRRRLAASWATGASEPAASPAAPGMTWLYLTLGLGLLFLAGQVLAWRALAGQGLYVATTPNSGFFYVLTALHALHLLGGVAALLYLIGRLTRGSGPTPVNALGAVSLYWHFMDVLWIYLLLILATRL
ncbi:MAG: cytochrome c oxidase subunit 3 [Gemmatimonadota bacterium]